MKKLLSFLTLTSLLSVNALAGEPAEKMQAFKHLSIGVEAGTMGAGVNLSMPIVKNHLVMTVGYNFPKFTYSTNFDANVGSVNADISEYNSKLDFLRTTASNYLPSDAYSNLNPIDYVNGKSKADATVDFANAKLMFEYYPSKNHNFHFTAGVMIGNEEFIRFEGHTSKVDWDNYNKYLGSIESANKVINLINNAAGSRLIDNYSHSEVSFRFDDTVCRVEDLDRDGTGDVMGSLMIQKVKPYFGIGFGRSVPNKRIGFQFEIGAWYHGNPTISIDNPKAGNHSQIDVTDNIQDIIETVKSIPVYPQITFRFTGRLF